MTTTIEEIWKNIPEFGEYDVSNLGRIYNRRTDKIMRTSCTNHGHVKITLASEWTRRRFTRSVALFVAEAFLEAPNLLCDQLVVLDGNFSNVAAHNLAWRPRWFAWKYTRQLKTEQPVHYHNLPVFNVVRNVEYESIVIAGMYEGLLFDDIWQSTYTSKPVYPNGSVFEIVDSELDIR